MLIFDCFTEVKVTTGHPAQGARFHLQSVRSIPGIKEWRERERERERVSTMITLLGCNSKVTLSILFAKAQISESFDFFGNSLNP